MQFCSPKRLHAGNAVVGGRNVIKSGNKRVKTHVINMKSKDKDEDDIDA